MSNPDHLNILNQGVPIWNEWRRANPSQEIDLEGESFTGYDLENIDLNRAKLRRTSFNGSALKGANLCDADLTEASLWQANLSGANCSGTNFTNCWIKSSILKHANFSGAKFFQCHLSKPDLSGANCTGADFSECCIRHAILEDTNFSGAKFSQCDLSQADFVKAILTGAQFLDTDLFEANFSQMDLQGVAFMESNLVKANLSRSNLSESNFAYADLSEANFSEANISEASFIDSKLSDTNLTKCLLVKANFCDAFLRRTLFSGADLSGANISGTTFANVDLAQVVGLSLVEHSWPPLVDMITFSKTLNSSEKFLTGLGMEQALIDFFRNRFYSCFISYSHADEAFAKKLYERLRGHGIRCWLDEHQLLPGDDLYKEIEKGINLWDKVLLCCSENSLKSWWVDNEIDSAFAKERQLMKERGRKVLSLIPLDLDGFLFSAKFESGKRQPLISRLTANFQGWESGEPVFETAFQLVVKSLHLDEGGREKPPPSRL